MHPTATRCVQWSVGLLVAGALVQVFGTQLYAGLADAAGAGAASGLTVVDLVLTIVRQAVMPLGASLIAAAVVIQVLAPSRERH